MAEANSFNTDLPTNILPTELTNELINDGLRQFWEILLTSIRICRKCLAMFSMDTICIFQSYQRT